MHLKYKKLDTIEKCKKGQEIQNRGIRKAPRKYPVHFIIKLFRANGQLWNWKVNYPITLNTMYVN